MASSQHSSKSPASTGVGPIIRIYGCLPAWGLPDVSPSVTTLVTYCHLVREPYWYASLDLANPPAGLHYDEWTCVADIDGMHLDATAEDIIAHLESHRPRRLDEGISASDRAQGTALRHLVQERLFWSGVVAPRWHSETGWREYRPYLVPGRDGCQADKLRSWALSSERNVRVDHIVESFDSDIDCLADFLDGKAFFLGDRPRSVDAWAYSVLRHIADQPFQWGGSGYVQSKPNLMAYLSRMRRVTGV